MLFSPPQAQRLALQQKRADQDKQQGVVTSSGTVLTKVQTPLQQKIVLQKVQTPGGASTAQKTTVTGIYLKILCHW